jgi:hypothetical protein
MKTVYVITKPRIITFWADPKPEVYWVKFHSFVFLPLLLFAMLHMKKEKTEEISKEVKTLPRARG